MGAVRNDRREVLRGDIGDRAPQERDVPGRGVPPEIGQTFLIGDGVGHRYRAPEGATRLFLGFADGFVYRGDPGWYDNNVGSLQVVVDGADH
jgi:hypothetical protein